MVSYQATKSFQMVAHLTQVKGLTTGIEAVFLSIVKTFQELKMTNYIATPTAKLALRSIEVAKCIDATITTFSNKVIALAMPHMMTGVAYRKIADGKLAQANAFITATESLAAWSLAELDHHQTRNSDWVITQCKSFQKALVQYRPQYLGAARNIAQFWALFLVVSDNLLNIAFSTDYDCNGVRETMDAIAKITAPSCPITEGVLYTRVIKKAAAIADVTTNAVTVAPLVMPDYETMTTRVMRGILKDHQVAGYSRMKKPMMVKSCQDLFNKGVIS